MAFIKLDLSRYFNDFRSFSLFPVEKASHPTVGSVVKAVSSMFHLNSDGKNRQQLALLHEDFFIHPQLPSDILLNLPGILILRPIEDDAAQGLQKNFPRQEIVEEKEEEEEEEEQWLPSRAAHAVAHDDLEEHPHDSFSSEGRKSVSRNKKRQKNIDCDDQHLSAQPSSKRMKVQKVKDKRRQCVETNTADQIKTEVKSLKGESPYTSKAASRKMRDLSSATVKVCGSNSNLENAVLCNSSSKRACESYDFSDTCDFVPRPDDQVPDNQVPDNSFCNGSVNSNTETCGRSVEHNMIENFSASRNSSESNVRRSRPEQLETLCVFQSHQNNSAGRDVHIPGRHQQQPNETLDYSCSVLEKDSAAGHSDEEESGCRGEESEELEEDRTEVPGKVKSKRRRKHNKRLKRERRRLRQLVYGEDLSALSEEQLSIAHQIVTILEEKHLGRGCLLFSTEDCAKVRHEYEVELAALSDVPFDLSKFPSIEEFSKWAENYDTSSRKSNKVSSRRCNNEEEVPMFASEHHSGVAPDNEESGADVHVVPVRKKHLKRADCSSSLQHCFGQSNGSVDLSSAVKYTSNITSTPICDTKHSFLIQNLAFDCTVSSVERKKSKADFDLSKFKNRVLECAERYRSSKFFQDFPLLNDLSNGEVSTFVHERKQDKQEKTSKSFSGSNIENCKGSSSPLDVDDEASLLPLDERNRYPFRVPPAPPRFPAVSDQVKSNYFFLSCMEEAREPLVYYRSDRALADLGAARPPNTRGNTLAPELSCDLQGIAMPDNNVPVPVTNADTNALAVQSYPEDDKSSVLSVSDSQADVKNDAQVGVLHSDTEKLAKDNDVEELARTSSVSYYRNGEKCVASKDTKKSGVCSDPNASVVTARRGADLSSSSGTTEVNSSALKDGSQHAHIEPAAYDVVSVENSNERLSETTNYGSSRSVKVHVLEVDEDNFRVQESATSVEQSQLSCDDPVEASAALVVTSVNSDCSEEKSNARSNGYFTDGGHSTANSQSWFNNAHHRYNVIQPEVSKLDENSDKENVIKNYVASAKDLCEKTVNNNRSKKYKPRVHSAVGNLLQMLRSKNRSQGPDMEPKSELYMTDSSYSEAKVDVEKEGTDSSLNYSGQPEKEINGTYAHKYDITRYKRVRKRNRKTRTSTRGLDHTLSAPSSMWDVSPGELNSVVDDNLQPSCGSVSCSAANCELPQEFCLAGLDVNSLPLLTSAPRVGDVIFFYESIEKRKCIKNTVNEECVSTVSGGELVRRTSVSVPGTNDQLKSSNEELQKRPECSPVVGRVLAVTDDGDVTLSTIDIPAKSNGDALETTGGGAAVRQGNRMRCVRWSSTLQPRLVFP